MCHHDEGSAGSKRQVIDIKTDKAALQRQNTVLLFVLDHRIKQTIIPHFAKNSSLPIYKRKKIVYNILALWGYSSVGSPTGWLTHPIAKFRRRHRFTMPPTHQSIIGESDIYNFIHLTRGYSSVGRALGSHSRGQRFESAYLHHELGSIVTILPLFLL